MTMSDNIHDCFAKETMFDVEKERVEGRRAMFLSLENTIHTIALGLFPKIVVAHPRAVCFVAPTAWLLIEERSYTFIPYLTKEDEPFDKTRIPPPFIQTATEQEKKDTITDIMREYDKQVEYLSQGAVAVMDTFFSSFFLFFRTIEEAIPTVFEQWEIKRITLKPFSCTIAKDKKQLTATINTSEQRSEFQYTENGNIVCKGDLRSAWRLIKTMEGTFVAKDTKEE